MQILQGENTLEDEDVQELVNGERQRAGLAPLRLDSQLCELADLKAQDMCAGGYFGHKSERFGSMSDLVGTVNGYTDRVGENIALNFSDEVSVHLAWMSSALHRKNILDKDYECFGFASAEYPGAGHIYVQVFTGSHGRNREGDCP